MREMRIKALFVWLICALVPPMAVVGAARGDVFAEQEALRARIDAVNEGGLAFVTGPSGSGIHHHAARVIIGHQSQEDGWVVLEQCHTNLDRVSAAQIVFNPRRSRDLSVVSTRNIDAAYAEGSSVQLRGIGADSQVCLRAESQALHRLGDGVFELRNGPFMRRFLDGYYPLHLSLQIEFPDGLSLADFEPHTQPGFAVVQRPGVLEVDARFEGELRTTFRFLRD